MESNFFFVHVSHMSWWRDGFQKHYPVNADTACFKILHWPCLFRHWPHHYVKALWACVKPFNTTLFFASAKPDTAMLTKVTLLCTTFFSHKKQLAVYIIQLLHTVTGSMAFCTPEGECHFHLRVYKTRGPQITACNNCFFYTLVTWLFLFSKLCCHLQTL